MQDAPTTSSNSEMQTTMEQETNNDANNIWSDWQIFTSKRSRTTSTSPVPNHNEKKTKFDNRRNINNINSANRYSILDKSAESSITVEECQGQPKPPPIYIPAVADIYKMIDEISKLIKKEDFHYKTVKNDQIRVMVSNIESYRKLIKHLENSNRSYHTYQLKQDRAFRFTIKGLNYSTPVDSIKAELTLLGHKVRNVMNVKSRKTKLPLSMFFVDLDPGTNNKDVYDIMHINYAIVTVEPLRKTDDLVQCYRCQEFGHTQSYCKKKYRCVKCGLDHSTAKCTKSNNDPPRCVHCLQTHTANYKGCEIYQTLLRSKKVKYDRLNINENRNINYVQRNQVNDPFPTQPVGNMSYADAVIGNSPRDNEKSLMNKIQMMSKQNELMNTLMQMMQMIISKLCN